MKKLCPLPLLLLVGLALAGCETTSSTSSSANAGGSRPEAARTVTTGSNIPRPADESPVTPTVRAGGGSELRDALDRSNR